MGTDGDSRCGRRPGEKIRLERPYFFIGDSLHHGSNEIHPIRDSCIIAKVADTGTKVGDPWPAGFGTDAEVQAKLDPLCPMLDDAHDCEEGGSRDNPAHSWIRHPLVDGCREVIIT
jgi:hypothetical protein